MSALEKLMKSNAWDSRFSLPTIPMHSNPWIYTAYCLYLAGKADGVDYRTKFWPGIDEFFAKCLLPSGVFTKWPGGGFTSHDEIMGAAWLRPGIAREILEYLEKNDGLYDSERPESPREDHNVYRFIFLKPYLKACADYRVSFVSQLVWSIAAIANCWNFTGDSSGVLLFMLMGDKMEKYPISGISVWFWRRRLTKKFGCTPKLVFSKHYLTECPVLAEIALETWE